MTAALDRTESIDALAAIVRRGNVSVLTGAGISTESGIPDYRGESGRARPATPMTYQTFTGSASARQRYWARSHLGWQRITGSRPNDGHRAVAALESQGLVRGVITQNVDGLHQAAGARRVTELHGALDRVRCLDCGALSPRLDLQRRLADANPDWPARPGDATAIKPDGDIDLSPKDIETFCAVDCEACGDGMLKPDVVFFGENVPPDRVSRCYELVESSAALLVLGTSLTVASGFRFVKRAADRNVVICLVNQGQTRGDRYASVVIGEPLGATLNELLARL